ncbi:hypothetical protein GXW78_26740 [Roseomonas terrae]|uniref:Uncharacterized protein n=1 Tax=Neoroseomonas terrae TaxID=424799 RepID=A0ABS5EQI7_9PROT|nr:hypothetical protein [Neoroseomonas terrae]MBR0653279.1 hypothetical protein [Neoroseomonas terrae]
MQPLVASNASPPNSGAQVEAYWKACAEIRRGELAIGIADLLPLAWSRLPTLRACVRKELARHGAAIH